MTGHNGHNGSNGNNGSSGRADLVDGLLTDLAALDIRLRVRDSKLNYDAPPGKFTDSLKQRVQALKPELLAHLSGVPVPATAVPLSSGQERMWFLNRLECQKGAQTGVYTEHLVFDLTGELDRRAMEGALSALTARHAALRSRFIDGANGPGQVILPPAPASLPLVDLTAAPCSAVDTALKACAHRPVNLSSDPHVSFTLFALAADHHILSVSAHHASWDGWSNGVFIADLATAYNALRAGQQPALPPLSCDVADVAGAQRAALASGVLNGQLETLRQSLDGYPTRLDLPADRPRATVADTSGEVLPVRISADSAAALAAAGRSAGATLYMTVLAGWALLLSRLSGAARLLIGAPVAAREGAAEESIIGYLSNTVAIPVDVGAASSFGALATQVRDHVLRTMAAQRVPFEKLVEALAPPRGRATTPLVQNVFAMQPRSVSAPALDGLRVVILPRHNTCARYELMLNLEPQPDGALQGTLTYATALFDRATVAAWADQFMSILRHVPQTWNAPLHRGAAESGGFATDTERSLAGIWGKFLQSPPTRRDDDFFLLGGHSLLLMQVLHRVKSSGLGKLWLADALGATSLAGMAALIDGHAAQIARESEPAEMEAPASDAPEPYDREVAMAELWRRVAKRHAGRIALTLADGTSMTYAALDRRAEAIAAGLLAAGPVDATVGLSVERAFEAIAAILGIWKAGAAYLPIDPKMPLGAIARLASDAGAHVVLCDGKGADRFSGATGVKPLCLDALPAAGAKSAKPTERGGGDPAYVMFTSGTTGDPKGVVVPHRAIARLALNRDDLAVCAGDVVAQAAPLAFDATTFELWSGLFNGATLRIIASEELLDPVVLGKALRDAGVTVMWLTAGLFCRVVHEAPETFAGLRLLITGGETVSPLHARRLLDAYPKLCLCNGYGPTENCCFTTLHVIERKDLDGPIPIGRPLAHNRVYVVDEQLNPVPAETWGELLCAGDGLALGYANRPELTAASFVSLPWRDGERAYRTGDIVRQRRDGVLEFQGRRDGQVKVRGHRIETSGIEAVLSNCAGVRECAVIVTGEGADKILVAFVVAGPGDGGGQEHDWRRALAERLPVYMMPARFVKLPALLVNANGKRDRNALALLAARAVEVVAAPANEVATDEAATRARGEVTGSREAAAPRANEATVRPIEAATRANETAARTCGVADAHPEKAVDYPLFTGQERLWLLQQVFPESSHYNVLWAFEMAGTLDTAAFTRALIALEERHHALRLRAFIAPDGSPRQRLAPAGELAPVIVDLAGESDPVAAAEARQRLELNRPFELNREAGARFFLMRLGESTWRGMFVIHHAVVDGWSLGVLLRDLGALYNREIGAPADLPPAPEWQFEDVAIQERAFAASSEGKALLARWMERMTPLPEPTGLPSDRRRPTRKNFIGATRKFVFDAACSAAIHRLAQTESVTPFTVCTALVQVLMHRLTGETDLALGTLVAGRDRAETQETVGFLVNTVVLRQTLDPEASFRKLISATRATCLNAVADQNCPFGALVGALGATRDLARNPLFDLLVVWQADPEPPRFHGLTTQNLRVDYSSAKFDLALYFGRSDDFVTCELNYSVELFGDATIAAFFDKLATLATAAMADPDRPIGSLNFLPDAERALVVEKFNATAQPLDTRRSIVGPLLERALAAPSAPAILWDGPPLDYRHFTARAGAVARRLATAGVRPGDTVAVCAPRSPELLIAIHGILMAGANYAALAADDPASRLAGLLEDLGHPVTLASAECRAKLEGGSACVLDLGNGREAETLDLGAPDLLAYILFTSGSTGRPKGVAVEQHSVLNRILWMQSALPIGPGDVILQKTPVTFDVSVWELFWWAWTGAAVAVPPPGAERDPWALVDAIERHGVTVVHFVPSMLAAFLACLADGRADARRLKRLRYVFASGEALDAALVERFDRLLHRPFGTQLHNLYGPTEATVDVTWQACSPWNGGDTVPIGRPIANTVLYILDGNGSPVPIGVAGEIHLGGPQVARGYINRPELTLEKFITDPFHPGGRLYRTGDLGRWRREGTVEYLGRMDQQVKVRGQRIEPGEVEHALETHPAVERAVVVPVEVQGLTELHGYLLTRDAVPSAALRGHLRDRLPEAMVPARFLRLETLPLTSSGKLDRKALEGTPLDRVEAPVASPPVPYEGAASSGELNTPPDRGAATPPILSEVEAEVRCIWKAILPDHDPQSGEAFFDAGGNSLLVVRLHEMLNTRWPGVFTIADLFACVTVAAQARIIVPAPAVALASPPPAPALELKSSAVPRMQTTPVVQGMQSVAVKSQAIAVVGMAVRLAGSDDLAGFWRDVSQGADLVHPLTPQRDAETRRLLEALALPVPEEFSEAAYLDDVMAFDYRRVRMSPADAALLDPEQRLFLETAIRALEDAGRGGASLDNARVGVFVGGAPGTAWREAVMRSVVHHQLEQVFALNVPSNIATRLSFLHNWRGPAALFDTACSSALVATDSACRSLRAGDCDWALVGGAKVVLTPHDKNGRISIDSSTGRTRAFDADADGTGVGEGSVVFVLRCLDDALADGDAIHGVILGSAVNQDGASSGMAAPNPEAQAEVISTAARNAGVALSSLSYIEAHGTGTSLGDPVEIDGLTRAFSKETAETGFAAAGSGKGNYGHLDGAAGALGMARALLCLAHDAAPPQPFFDAPNPRIDFARAPVAVHRQLTPLADRGVPHRAGVSAFGLSGINAHVIMEAPPPVRPRTTRPGWVAVGLSAPDQTALRAYAGAIVAALRVNPEAHLDDIVRSLADGRDLLPARLAMCVRDRGDLMARLAVFAVAPDAAGDLVLTGTAARAGDAVSAVHANQASAAQAAAAFVAGARLVWPADRPAGRVHLPAAPLDRRRCAPELRPAIANSAPAGLLGPVAVTPAGRFHALDVHAPEFWPVAEHLLEGQPTLVGMAFPSLLAEAFPGKTLRIKDLRWIRPLRPAELERSTVTLAIAPDGAATVSGRNLEGKWQTFAKASLEFSEDAQPDLGHLDPVALASRCAKPVDAEPFQPRHGIVEVSRRWDCIERTAAGDDELVGWLHSPDTDSALRLHPGLLDIAATLGLPEHGLAPAGCASIAVAGELPAESFAHATRRPVANGIEVDLRLADRTGRVVAVFLGLRFARMLAIGEPVKIIPAVPVWCPSPLDVRDPGGPVAVIGEGPLADKLAHYLSSANRLASRSASGDIHTPVAAAPAIVFAPASGPDAGTRAAAAMRSVLASLRQPTQMLALGQGAFATDSGPLDPFQALTYGVVATAALEESMLTARYVDTDCATDPADLLAELAALDKFPHAVAWREGRRLVRCFEASPAQRASNWPTGGCCVVTGGTGGLSLLLAESLAAGGRVALALLSRGGTPRGDDFEAAARRDQLAALRAGGWKIETYACDVADRDSLCATLARIRKELGPITAVVHNAGVPDGAFLSSGERSVALYATALEAKVKGVCLLDELTAGDTLQAFVMGGSLTALTGAAGHSAYTGANAFLDAFAVLRRRRGKPAMTVNWCEIREMGMAVRLRKRSAVGDAGSAEVGPLFARALASGAPQIAMLVPALDELLRLPVGRLTAPQPAPATTPRESAPPQTPAPASATVPAPPRAGGGKALEAALAAIWSEVLGYDSIAPDADFYELGGDSIAGARIVAQIVRDLGHAMTLADLFQSGTVAALAARLRGRAAEKSPVNRGIQPAPARDLYPVAWEQLSVLRAEEAADMGVAYNLPTGLELPAEVDMGRLRAALNSLIERHEILRTRFIRPTAGGEPLMEILAAAPAVIEEIDLPGDTAPAEGLKTCVRPFDLWSGVPVRFVLGLVDGRPRVLLVDIHHALADAFSAELLLSELTALYAGTAAPASAIHLKDYAWWSRAADHSASTQEARAYWLECFEGPLPLLDLPADRPRPARHTWRADSAEFPIAMETLHRLRAFAAERRTTPFAVVTAAWALLLSRYARTEDVVIATPVDSREGTAIAGMMVSLLPVRLAVPAQESVAAFIQRTHTTLADAHRHRVYGLSRLLEDLAPPAAPGRALLSDVLLSYMNFDGPVPAPGREVFPRFSLPRPDGKGDLAIYIRDLPGQMYVTLEYYAAIFDRDRMQRMGLHFRTLLDALVTSGPDRPAGSLPLIDAQEAEQLTLAGQGNQPALPGLGLFGQFAERATATPDAVALEGTGMQLTYGELLLRAGGIAASLRDAGVSPGDRVALHLERDANAIVLLLGTVAAGATYVPLDPAWPAERVAWILDDCACRVVVADAAGRALLPASARVLEAEGLLSVATAVPTPPGAGGAAYIMYTSGSTGKAKAVVIPQAAVLRLAFSGAELSIFPQDRVVQSGPLAFDASTFEIWNTLLNGARLVVASREEILDPEAFAATLKRRGVTVLWITTALFHRQVDAAPESFRCLRIVLTGGEAMSVAHCSRALQACPSVVFINCYGPTENTTFTTLHHVTPADLAGPTPIGRPISHTRVAVVEPGGAPAPFGVWGEIVTGGLGLAEGYLNRPELTAERFVEDPAKPGERCYRTGDLGRWRSDGVLEFGGRCDGQIKLRGYRIELEEIEQALNGHPGVAASAALLLRDAAGDGSIVACIQPVAEAPEPAALREWLSRTLPVYMTPRRFVTVSSLPLTANGKLDRARLEASLPVESNESVAGEPPRNDAERMMAGVFAEVFGRPVNHREANFIDFGGHSLLAIKVVNRIAQATGVRLAMRDFFASPTVAGLAALVAGRNGSGDAIVPAAEAPYYPASHAQARLYLATRMSGSAEAAYNMTFALPLTARLDLDALREALARLAARHQTLRTGFVEEDGRIVQRISDNAIPPLAVDDVSGESDPRAESLRLARREGAAPFDLAHPPLFRARAIRLGATPQTEESWLVLLALHHIVCDGWSTQILLRELSELYRAAQQAKAAALPALPIAYRDFAAWQSQRDWTASAAHWRALLAGAPQHIALPADHPAAAAQSHRGDTVTRVLPAILAGRLSQYARVRGTTNAALGLTLFASLLYRLTRQDDMIIGMGSTGRDRAEAEGLIGFFVNILPMRIRIGEEAEFGTLVDQVHASLMAAMDHRDYPFDLLVRTLAPRRVANRQPLMNVVYEYQQYDLEGGKLAGGDREAGIFGPAMPADPAYRTALMDAIRPPTAKYDLLLFFIERDGTSEFTLEYDTDLLDRATAERWLGYLEQFASMAVK